MEYRLLGRTGVRVSNLCLGTMPFGGVADTPIEETLRALDNLVRQGKILYPAVSNWAAWQIAKALGISAREGLARFECVQPMYNLVKRQAEVEILPLAQAEQGAASFTGAGSRGNTIMPR